MPTPPLTLVRLPSSPSPSPIASDDESSDPSSSTAAPKRILGVRELVALGKIRKSSTNVSGGIEILGHPDLPPSPAARLVGGNERSLFALDVVITGWKVVGGKGWEGRAKIGAYVGM